jgi:hypothetical protein
MHPPSDIGERHMNDLPQDLQGLRVYFQGNFDDQGTVIRDLREERVKVEFDRGETEYVPREELTVMDDAD